MYVRMYVCIYMPLAGLSNVYICIYIYIYIYSHTYTYTYTYIRVYMYNIYIVCVCVREHVAHVALTSLLSTALAEEEEKEEEEGSLAQKKRGKTQGLEYSDALTPWCDVCIH